MSLEVEKLRIHFFYWVVMLVGMIVLIATDRWTSSKGFTEYLTNAATMTSLVLALVAIFYSFIANDGLSKSLGNISTVANEVKQSKDQISKFVELTTSSADTAQRSTSAMNAFSNEVTSTLKTLDTALSAVSARTESLTNAVDAIPTRLDRLEINVIEAAKIIGEKTQAAKTKNETEEIPDGIVTTFLRVQALSTNLFTFACVLAHQYEKPLSIEEVCTALDVQLQSYYSGFLSCMHCVDLLSRESVKDRPSVYVITSVHNVLLTSAESYFTDYVRRTYKDKPDQMSSWSNKLIKIKRLFDEAGA